MLCFVSLLAFSMFFHSVCDGSLRPFHPSHPSVIFSVIVCCCPFEYSRVFVSSCEWNINIRCCWIQRRVERPQWELLVRSLQIVIILFADLCIATLTPSQISKNTFVIYISCRKILSVGEESSVLCEKRFFRQVETKWKLLGFLRKSRRNRRRSVGVSAGFSAKLFSKFLYKTEQIVPDTKKSSALSHIILILF